jgi:heat shock protein HtpX
MKNQLKTVLLLGLLSGILVAIGGAIGPSGLVIFTILALAMNLGAYFFSDRLVLRAHRAREVSAAEAPVLHRMVGELAGRAGIPMPRICIIPSAQPNAFATGRDPKHGVVAVTEGILRMLNERELRGVLAHELAHIKNRDILVATIAAAIAAVITSIAHVLSYAAILGGTSRDENSNPLGGILIALVAPVAAALVQMGISRSREYLADESGARFSGDPEALASALLKIESAARGIPMATSPATASLFIVNPLSGRSLAGLFSTHPATAERVRRLLEMAGRGAPLS